MSQANANPFLAPSEDSKPPSQPPPSTLSRVLFWGSALLFIVLLIAMLLPLGRYNGTREAARRSKCQYNLKQIALAMLNYEARHGSLPPAYTVDESGAPLHSWRVLILPFMEQQALYNSIDLTKPWNDPINAVFADAHTQSLFLPDSSNSEDGKYLPLFTIDAGDEFKWD